MSNRRYKLTGMNSTHAPLREILRHRSSPTYNHRKFSIASHLAQSVGPGASSVGLGEGAKPDAPRFSQTRKNNHPALDSVIGKILFDISAITLHMNIES